MRALQFDSPKGFTYVASFQASYDHLPPRSTTVIARGKLRLMAQRGEDIPPGEFCDSGKFSFGTSKMVGRKICFLLQVGIFKFKVSVFRGIVIYSDVLPTPPFRDILAIFGQSCWRAHFFC